MESVPSEILEEHMIPQMSPRSRSRFARIGKRYTKSTKSVEEKETPKKKQLIDQILQFKKGFSEAFIDVLGYIMGERYKSIYDEILDKKIKNTITEKEKMEILKNVIENLSGDRSIIYINPNSSLAKISESRDSDETTREILSRFTPSQLQYLVDHMYEYINYEYFSEDESN